MEFIILFIYFNLINSLTLGKYGTIEVDWKFNSLLFDSSGFLLGDEMNFKFRTNGSCGSNISYGYYDTFQSLYKSYETQFQAFINKEEIKDEYEIKYFTIKKNSEDLNELEGKYLLLKYNCTDTVEITNINPDNNLNIGYILVIVFACIVLSFAVTIIIIFIRKVSIKKEKSKNNQSANDQNTNNQNANEQNKNNQNANEQNTNNQNANEQNTNNQNINNQNTDYQEIIYTIKIQKRNSESRNNENRNNGNRNNENPNNQSTNNSRIYYQTLPLGSRDKLT